jgi:ABC-2 type transport system permease protein
MVADPSPIIVVVAVPLLLLIFVARGVVGGPGQSVPGLAVMFGYFGIAWVGTSFFRDHGWNTWVRYRTSAIHPIQVLLGKAAPFAALLFAQQLLLLALGRVAFGMPWHGNVVAISIMCLAVVLAEIAMSLLLVSACRSINQLNAVAYVGALLLVGVGGGLTRRSQLPSWIREVSPVSPVYWTLKGYHSAIESSGLGHVLVPVGVLLSAAVVCGALTIWLYDFDQSKTYFA